MLDFVLVSPPAESLLSERERRNTKIDDGSQNSEGMTLLNHLEHQQQPQLFQTILPPETELRLQAKLDTYHELLAANEDGCFYCGLTTKTTSS